MVFPPGDLLRCSLDTMQRIGILFDHVHVGTYARGYGIHDRRDLFVDHNQQYARDIVHSDFAGQIPVYVAQPG